MLEKLRAAVPGRDGGQCRETRRRVIKLEQFSKFT